MGSSHGRRQPVVGTDVGLRVSPTIYAKIWQYDLAVLPLSFMVS